MACHHGLRWRLFLKDFIYLRERERGGAEGEGQAVSTLNEEANAGLRSHDPEIMT